MCRLFALTTEDKKRVGATFWLLDAPDSIEKQSQRMPDGAGVGWFSLGEEPVRDRAPLAAYQSSDFTRDARYAHSHTFIAHIRYASTGALTTHNTHPFYQKDRLFAHNGVVLTPEVIESWMSPVERSVIKGESDSERVFAYITAEIDRHGDTLSGLHSAVSRIGAELGVYALNIILAESDAVYALRYPDTHELWCLTPDQGPFHGTDHSVTREHGTMRLAHPEDTSACVIASEPLDTNPGWRLMDPYELLVISHGEARSHTSFVPPLTHPVSISQLTPEAAASQQHPHTGT